jgi:hypothetical protein
MLAYESMLYIQMRLSSTKETIEVQEKKRNRDVSSEETLLA